MLLRQTLPTVLLLFTVVYVSAEHDAYFQSILDKLKTIDNTVNEVRESVANDQTSLQGILTDLQTNVKINKEGILEDIQNVDNKISEAEKNLGDSIGDVDSQVVMIFSLFSKSWALRSFNNLGMQDGISYGVMDLIGTLRDSIHFDKC